MTDGLEALLSGLDVHQRAAAEMGPGPALVVAPAGSGKTATLVARIGVLLASGVEPARILVVTFNRDAAAELSRRIEDRLGVMPGKDGPEVRTLHALARRVMVEAGFQGTVVADRLPLLRATRRRVLAQRPAETTLPSAEELDGRLSSAILAREVLPDDLGEVLRVYQGLLAARGAMDFDGLVAGALGWLREDPSCRDRWQARYVHVLVDEFQDVDPAEAELVAVLAEPEANLFVVGDDDQTIYAWRLADVRRILDFPRRYPSARRVVLETNYRCPPPVVAAADRLISHNRERVAKRLRVPAGSTSPVGAEPMLTTWPLRGPDAVDGLVAALPTWAANDGGVAVLARTRAELIPVVTALARRGIRHATTVPTALDAAPVATLLDDLRNGDPAAVPLSALLAARARRGWRRADGADELGDDAHAALDAAIGWAIDLPRTDAYLAAFTRARARFLALRDPAARIEVTTVHGAKGREWPAVVVLGLEVDRFPNRRALADAEDPARALEEERRLAYVAVTRCRRRLVLAFDPERPSPFVAELMGAPSRRRGRRPATATPAYRPTSGATASR